ncbi:MAG: hypothetical protein JSS49_09545 [Planctomycetes bacterium]|nr:hypothetical protein [Planctomycetota bacterium]
MPTALPCLTIDRCTDTHAETSACLVLETEDRSLVVDRDRIRIGASPLCEIQLQEGPALHSVIRVDNGVTWIEADESVSDLMVNWRNCRRMALRNEDVILVPGLELTVRERFAVSIADAASGQPEEITALSAEELCDRILSEQSVVDEFESTRLDGVKKLMAAIKQVARADYSDTHVLDSAPAGEFADDCERLLDQIREMSEMMTGRTQELDQCEGELIAATSLLQETQERVSRQIDDLLDQIADVSPATELRASA